MDLLLLPLRLRMRITPKRIQLPLLYHRIGRSISRIIELSRVGAYITLSFLRDFTGSC